MSDRKPEPPFETLPIPHRDLPGALVSRYRIYKSKGEYIMVEAGSALEALKASGLNDAVRIERDTIYFTNVLDLGALGTMEATAGEAAPAIEAVTEAATLPAEAAALSSDEVNKLMESGGAGTANS